jgi:hypothetical protein
VFICSGCFQNTPKGSIIPLSDNFKVGEPIPFVLEAPEEYDDLHMEMWFCTLETEGESVYMDTYVEEQTDLEANYTQAEVEALFNNSPVDIYRPDYAMVSLYSPRIMLFTPLKTGTYTIGVSGYYHSTSPSDVTSLGVVVHE